MKILVEAANHAYSFVLQAEALVKGFNQNGISTHLILVNATMDIESTLEKYRPDCIIAVGNWTDFDLLVKIPHEKKYKIIPWIVSDDYKITNFVNQYNSLPLIITPSRHCKDNLVRSGIKEEIVKIVPEAVDCDIWQPATNEKKMEFLEYLSVPIVSQTNINRFDLLDTVKNKIPVIYTTGGDATKKGAREVIKALSLIDKEIPWLYMIKTWPGVVTFANSIEELTLADELGVADRVRYLVGEFSQQFMVNLMNLCDIYAAPSRLEGFGLPLVEAQMCGKPVVTTSGTATEETVLQEKTGLICQRANTSEDIVRAEINDLSNNLKKIIIDPELRKSMGQNAIEHARNKYSPNIIANQFSILINNL